MHVDLEQLLSEGGAAEAASLLDRFWSWLATGGVRIVLILVLAALLRFVLRWLIRRFFRTMMDSGTAISSVTNAVAKRDKREIRQAQARREQRAETLSSVAVNVASAAIGAIAIVMVLSEVGIDVAPVIAGLGVAGLAAGIGAQTIIKDFIAGLVMLFEDIIAVGDVVDLQFATGTVVNINLRVTQVRSLDGALWTVRNGEIIRIANMSRGFANAVVEVQIAGAARNAEVTAALEEVARGIWADEDFHDVLIDEPTVSGILAVDGARFSRRVVAKVQPGQQWAVEQELRLRIRMAFAESGIEFAMPAMVPQPGGTA
ncbi:mechanosensitive ion channel family protein [Brachybacterium huguangmaarense]